MQSEDLDKEKQLQQTAFFNAIKADREAFEIYKRYVAEKDEGFIKYKSFLYEELEKRKTSKAKYEFAVLNLRLITNAKLGYEANIHKEWTAEEKIRNTPKKQPVFEQLISFCKNLIVQYSELLELEGKTGTKQKAVVSKKKKNSFSLRQIAIAYVLMDTIITKENAEEILKKHSTLNSTDKLIQKRINKRSDLIKLTENKSTDTKHLKDLKEAERLLSGTKNEQAKTEIKRVIAD